MDKLDAIQQYWQRNGVIPPGLEGACGVWDVANTLGAWVTFRGQGQRDKIFRIDTGISHIDTDISHTSIDNSISHIDIVTFHIDTDILRSSLYRCCHLPYRYCQLKVIFHIDSVVFHIDTGILCPRNSPHWKRTPLELSESSTS